MKIPIRWLNCLWLIVPLLVWNLIFASRLTQPIFLSDGGVPSVVLIAETALRIAVFGLPLLIPLRWDQRVSQIGIGLYLVGVLIYFATWLPLLFAPDSAWSMSTIGLLGPSLTPLLVFVGIALIGRSWSFALIGFVFTLIHASHSLFALNIL